MEVIVSRDGVVERIEKEGWELRVREDNVKDYVKPEYLEDLVDILENGGCRYLEFSLPDGNEGYFVVCAIRRKDGIHLCFWDAGELNKLKDEVESLRRYTQNLIDSMEEGILILDTSFRISYLNRFLKNMSIRGEGTVFDVFPELKGKEEIFAEVLDGEHVEPVDFLHNGRFLRLKLFPFIEGKKITGVVALVEDRTDAVEKEKEVKTQKIIYLIASLFLSSLDIKEAMRKLGEEIKREFNPEFFRIFTMRDEEWEEVFGYGKGEGECVEIEIKNKKMVRFEFPSYLKNTVLSFLGTLKVGLERNLLYEDQIRYINFLSSLLEISRHLEYITSLTHAMESLAQEIMKLIKVDNITIFRKDGENLIPVYAAGEGSEEIMKLRLRVGEGFTGWVASSGIPDFTNDALNDPRALYVPGTKVREESLLSAPIKVEERTVGVITLSRAKKNAFTQEDLKMVTIIASMLGSIMERLRLFADIEERFRKIEFLYHLSESYFRYDMKEFLEETARGLKEFGPYVVTILYLAPGGELEFVAYEGFTEEDKRRYKKMIISLKDPFLKEILKGVMEGKIFEAPDVKKDEKLVKYLKKETVSFYIFPIFSESRFWGIMTLGYNHYHRLTDEEKNFFTSVANFLSNAMARWELRKEEREGREQLEGILRILKHMERARSEKSIYKCVAKEARKMLKALRVFIFIKRGKKYRIVEGDGKEIEKFIGREIKEGEALTGIAIKEKRFVFSEEGLKDERVKKLEEVKEHGRTIAAYPIWMGNEVIGAITVSVKEPKAIKKTTEIVLKNLSVELSAGLERFEREKTLKLIEKILKLKGKKNMRERIKEVVEKELKDVSDELGKRILDKIKDFIEFRIHMAESESPLERAFTKAVVEDIPTGIILVDNKEKVVKVNKFAAQILGYTAKEIRGKKLTKVLGVDESSPFRDVLQKGKSVKRAELMAKRKDGKEIPIGFSASPVRDIKGEIVGGLLIFRDLTEIKEMEQHLRRQDRLAALGEMSAGMAHEIKNPLAAIKAGVQFIGKNFPDGSKEKEWVYLIVKEINRIDRIVKDMISYARRPPLRRTWCDIRIPIKHALGIAREAAMDKKLIIEEEYIGDIPKVYVDEDQMTEVLTNLLLNAIDAVKEKGRVKISARMVDNNLEITVEDTGEGIPPENLDKIFNPFFTTKKGGTGLGLSITHRIVQEHGGKIKVESEVGKGTKVTLIIPGGFEHAKDTHS